jgi:hypothetical protein
VVLRWFHDAYKKTLIIGAALNQGELEADRLDSSSDCSCPYHCLPSGFDWNGHSLFEIDEA